MVQRDPHLQTDRVTPALLGYIVQKIVRHLAPDQIILFGSRARGEADEESDLDLFIIQSSAASNREVRRQVDRLLLGRRFSLSHCLFPLSERGREVSQGLSRRSGLGVEKDPRHH
ncbi:MAG: nucleotidyltransferase domain-containing protein [Chloroflexota bacterium]|nr:nucleotidyltransferase domain-containing protein [Chloroflexota bacterium]